MSRYTRKIRPQLVAARLFAVFAALGSLLLLNIGPGVAHAQATITQRSLQLSNNIPSQQSRYLISMTAPAAPLVGSIKVEFCGNSPLPEIACTPPPGIDLSAATLLTQSGEIGFSIDASSTADMLILSRVPVPTLGLPSTYELQSVINSSASGSQFARYSTYASNNASGSPIDRGSVAYVLDSNFSITTEVPPYLDFCLGIVINSTDCSDISGDYLSLGDFSPKSAKSGQTQMVIATNAENGYMISINGNALASGNNALSALSVPTVSAPGVNQFGINLRANSNPQSGADPSGAGSGMPEADYNMPNRFTFRTGDAVASNPTGEGHRKFTTTYLVNVSNTQTAGIYGASYTYVALGNF